MNLRYLLIFGLTVFSSLAFAANTTTHLTAQERSAHCAAMGGIDITLKSISDSQNYPDFIACEINDETKFSHYFKQNHPDQTIKKAPLITHNGKATGYVASVANGFYDQNDRRYEYVYYVTGNGSTTENVTGWLYIQNEFSCGWISCTAYDIPISLTAYANDVNQKVVLSYLSHRSDYSRIDCTAGVDTFDSICVHNTYTTLDGSRMDGVITHYETPNKELSIDRSLGKPDQTPSCNLPSSYVGNPINMSTGNKFQEEIDLAGSGAYPLSFIRSYNSLNSDKNKVGIWTYNYAMHINAIKYNDSTITFKEVDGDGKEIPFYYLNDQIKNNPTEFGNFEKTDTGYKYVSQLNETFYFNNDGDLLKTVNSAGLVHNIRHISDTEMIVSDSFGHSLTITETKDHQPLSVKASDGTLISYSYDEQNRLVKMTKDGKSRIYHYEDSRFPRALTGITDKNGERYVSWTYDDKGRANSSYHAGGKDKVQVSYDSDTQTSMINPLGYKYIYYYDYISGVKRINAIRGQGASLCPAIGSSYQYNNRGLVTMGTDGRGIRTQYNYNDAGQETSRVVGYGSANAVTITTTWDSRFFAKPKTETYPDKVITYDYDNKGSLINETVTAK